MPREEVRGKLHWVYQWDKKNTPAVHRFNNIHKTNWSCTTIPHLKSAVSSRIKPRMGTRKDEGFSLRLVITVSIAAFYELEKPKKCCFGQFVAISVVSSPDSSGTIVWRLFYKWTNTALHGSILFVRGWWYFTCIERATSNSFLSFSSAFTKYKAGTTTKRVWY